MRIRAPQEALPKIRRAAICGDNLDESRLLRIAPLESAR
jgi:hypothetical protein